MNSKEYIHLVKMNRYSQSEIQTDCITCLLACLSDLLLYSIEKFSFFLTRNLLNHDSNIQDVPEGG